MDLDEIKALIDGDAPPRTSPRWRSPADELDAAPRALGRRRRVAAAPRAGGDRSAGGRTRRARAAAPAADAGRPRAARPASSTCSPSPGEPAFVAVGQAGRGRRRGRVIEAMKVFNEIRAERDGTVEAVLRRLRRRGRGRPAAPADRVGTDVRLRPDRQPRRDRAAHPARLPRARACARSPSIPRPTATRRTSATPTSPSASARRRPRGATSTRRRSCSRPRRPARRRSIRATASCRRTPTSPSASTQAGLTFIGPSAACIRTMGDKVAAKRAMLRGRRALRAGAGRRRCPTTRRRSGGIARGDRLSGHPQGGRRRRRARHARRARRRRPRRRAAR